MNGAGTPGVRGELEHNPRDPFKGNVPAILAEIGPAWPEYQPAYEDGWWTARRKDGTGDPLKALSPDELIAAMRDAS
jgi:hypothetical protein